MRDIKLRLWNGYGMDYDPQAWSESINESIREYGEKIFWMLNTGLKDQNKNDIYEGDIISFIEVDEDSCLSVEKKLIGEIKWIDDCAQFRCVYPSGRRRELYLIVGADYVYDVKVIGNIYQNPDLLVKK